MRIRTNLFRMFALGVALVLLAGCSAVPASEPSESQRAPEKLVAEQPTAEAELPNSPQEAPQKESVAQNSDRAMESEQESQPVRIGYKVGMQAPEFGMSLIDGSRVTASGLADQGKPAFLYFHATW